MSSGRATPRVVGGGPVFRVCLLVTLALARGAGAGPAPGVDDRLRADSLMLDRALATQRFDSVSSALQRDLAELRGRASPRQVTRLLVMQGIARVMSGWGRESIAPLDEAAGIALARRDTALALVALRWRTYAAGMLGDFVRQEALADSLDRLAVAARDDRYRSVALNFSGWLAMRRGDLAAARARLERAVAIQRRLGLDQDESIALTTLGSVLGRTGDIAAARAVYARQLELARRAGNRWTEAQVFAGLGSVEILAGDAELAAEYYRRALDFHCGAGETYDCAASIFNWSSTLLAAGRTDSAVAVARRGLDLSVRRGYAPIRSGFLAQIARGELARGRVDAARRAWTAIGALGDTADAEAHALAALGLSNILRRERRYAEGVVTIERALTRTSGLLPLSTSAGLRGARLGHLLAAGRVDEVARTGPGLAREAAAASLRGPAIVAWSNASIALLRKGRWREAGDGCEEATRTAELARAEVTGPEWRSAWGRLGAAIASDCAFIALGGSESSDPDRVASAYEASRPFRARSLLERVSPPAGGGSASAPAWSREPWPSVTVAELRRGVLRPGELLLEWISGPNLTLLFAIAPDTQRVAILPGLESQFGGLSMGDTLEAAIAALAGVESVKAASEVTDAVGRTLARALFGSCEPLVRRATRLLLAPDGPLHRVPFAALALGDRLIGDSHELVHVHSGALLARQRLRPAPERGRGMLAFDAGGAPGAAPLAAARREVRWLANSFEAVDAAAAADARASVTPGDLARYAALHFAGHTSLNDESPWHSGIVLRSRRAIGSAEPDSAASRSAARGASPTPALTTGFLTADEISRLDLPARLVVLASCESGLGRDDPGEGLAGLTTAFLVAGARSVVGTLWAVDDRVTERLVRAFYEQLARGLPGAAALREAQRTIRGTPATRHPYYWAGFVLAGDGDTRLGLRPRRAAPATAWAVAGTGCLAVALAWFAHRRSQRRFAA